MKLPSIDFDKLERSRLKLTIAGMVVIALVWVIPIIVIIRAANQSIYDINAPWVFFGTAITAFGGIIGYYVNKESQRPSLLTTYTNFNAAKEPDEEIIGESDPADIPL